MVSGPENDKTIVSFPHFILFFRCPLKQLAKGIIFSTSARPIHLLEEDNNIVLLDILMYYNVFRIHLVFLLGI